MYTAIELRTLQTKPRINDITLQTLQEFYEIYLHPFIYTYRIRYLSGAEKTICIRFDKSNFCHLLGIESIAKGFVKFKERKKYRGLEGWNNIKNGTIDIKHLKALNKKKFNSVKAKYVYFHYIPDLMEQPLAVNYDRSKVIPPTNIDCEILFYNQRENAIVHLGLDKSEHEGYYVPRTFFIEKLNDTNAVDIYIEGQERIIASKETQTITA